MSSYFAIPSSGSTGEGHYERPEASEPFGASELGKDAFLRLLTTQLRYQDPMSPVDDQQFLAQMAQFTALEQMQNLNTTLQRFVEADQWATLFSDATNLLGKHVDVVGPSGDTHVGIVEAVRTVDGVPKIVVQDMLFNVRDVVRVTSPERTG